MPHKVKYVVGFALDDNLEYVCLIKKIKPEWQKDHWNGVGGKIEEGEQPVEAMVREFEEETGVKTEQSDWIRFQEQHWSHAELHFFKAVLPLWKLESVRTTTAEQVRVFHISHLYDVNRLRTIHNIRWLLMQAIDEKEYFYRVDGSTL